MSLNKTSIPWATHSVNVTAGCTPAGVGCERCYAERLHTQRHEAWKRDYRYAVPLDEAAFANCPQYHKPFSKIQLLPERLDDLRRAPAGSRVFVDSMADLFHPDVPFEFIDDVIYAAGTTGMDAAQRPIFILATKRPERVLDWYKRRALFAELFPNIHLLTSVSTQDDADRNIPPLLQIPAAVRGISYEPVLGPLDLTRLPDPLGPPVVIDALGGYSDNGRHTQLGWVIIGVESGPNRRPCKQEWIRDVVQDCQAAGVPVFVKSVQANGRVLKDWANASEEEWPSDLRIREYPTCESGQSVVS
jgi:protein gp37